MNASRKSLLIWIVAIVAVGVLTFVLLGRSSDSPVRESGPATTGVDGTSPEDSTASSGSDGAAGLSGEVAQGNEGTAAGQDAYTTYLGGDFDDDSPNTEPPVGADEFGCDQNYAGACVPSPPARVTCADIGVVNFEVVLGDPHFLDGADQDGVACDDETIVRTPYGEGPPEPPN